MVSTTTTLRRTSRAHKPKIYSRRSSPSSRGSSKNGKYDDKMKKTPPVRKSKRKSIKIYPPSPTTTPQKKIRVLTLRDIKSFTTPSKKKNLPDINTRELFRIASKSEREKLYAEAADAISAREIAALPTFGDREWKCHVTITEKGPKKGAPKNSVKNGPLFRWFRGRLELACLPHILSEAGEVEELDGNEYSLHQRKISTLSEEAVLQAEQPLVQRLWISPQLQPFKLREQVLEHVEELERQETLVERVLYGYGCDEKMLKPFKPGSKQALEAGYYRFLRDGLWVIGQEETWQEEREKHFTNLKPMQKASTKNNNLTGAECYVQAHRNTFRKKRLAELNGTHSHKKQKYTLEEASKELRKEYNELTLGDKRKWINQAYQKKKQNAVLITPEKNSSYNQPGSRCTNVHLVSPDDTESEPETTKPKSKKLISASRWTLSKRHQDLCHKACMDHYEMVMNTVKARALFSELADGFDVLRERGRGRFDMELPEFDTEPFAFLSSPKASWMPVVRKILGDEAMLIHKGCFISFPGSETQVYHQDGLHLSNTQKPCYAVNVFIPLVDLTAKHGPTEFCLGTHIIGNENYKKDQCETPLVKAGTPIIFDYRVGHRGMSNTSSEPRPVVYLTYTGKGFRDSVNFSRRRYHKIGALVSPPISREERTQRRMKQKELAENSEDEEITLVSPNISREERMRRRMKQKELAENSV